jgi:CheY-like chemotaxis protein
MPSILVIDDDKLVRETMKIMLRAGGYDVTVAADGKSGIEAIKAQSFDVAIVDLFMPEMNGLKVLEVAGSSDCPPMPGFEDMASEAGAALTLYKPFRPADVLHAVEQAMRKAA